MCVGCLPEIKHACYCVDLRLGLIIISSIYFFVSGSLGFTFAIFLSVHSFGFTIWTTITNFGWVFCVFFVSSIFTKPGQRKNVVVGIICLHLTCCFVVMINHLAFCCVYLKMCNKSDECPSFSKEINFVWLAVAIVVNIYMAVLLNSIRAMMPDDSVDAITSTPNIKPILSK